MMLVVTSTGEGSILYVWFIAWYEIVEARVFDLGIGFIRVYVHICLFSFYVSVYTDMFRLSTCFPSKTLNPMPKPMFIHRFTSMPWICVIILCHHFGWRSSGLVARQFHGARSIGVRVARQRVWLLWRSRWWIPLLWQPWKEKSIKST